MITPYNRDDIDVFWTEEMLVFCEAFVVFQCWCSFGSWPRDSSRVKSVTEREEYFYFIFFKFFFVFGKTPCTGWTREMRCAGDGNSRWDSFSFVSETSLTLALAAAVIRESC